ncbi:MAG: hypothetical protein J6R47_05105 [Acholeplasmatales bacterium]|nr:hypothetical protein [Acholeplasmatales bacterium]
MKWYNKFTTIIRQRDFIEWLEEDPILLDRELICVYGIVENEPWFKIGDGKSRFSELNYITQISELLPYFDCFVRTSKNKPVRRSRFILNPRGTYEEE